LLEDGEVVAFGDNSDQQCKVPTWAPGSRAVEVAAGFNHSLVLLNTGELLAFGSNDAGQTQVPQYNAAQLARELASQPTAPAPQHQDAIPKIISQAAASKAAAPPQAAPEVVTDALPSKAAHSAAAQAAPAAAPEDAMPKIISQAAASISGTVGQRVVNGVGTVVAAQAAGAALEALRKVPFVDFIISPLEKFHTAYKAHESIQHEVENLATRLNYLIGQPAYNKLERPEKERLDAAMKQAAEEMEKCYGRKRTIESVLVPEEVAEDLRRANGFLSDAVADIALYKVAPAQQQRQDLEQFQLLAQDVVVDQFLTESRCRVFVGTLRIATGDIATVAVKVCRPKGAATVEQLQAELLQNECRLQRQARHQNVLRLLGMCVGHEHPECLGCVLLLTPYMELGSLGQLLSSADTASERQATARTQLTQRPQCLKAVPELLLGLSSGLKHLHAVDPPIVHLDVKPDNILVDYERTGDTAMQLTPKLADFDISRELDAGRETTKEYSFQGTMRYTSPEQVFPGVGKKKGPKSDVYAFGMVIYFLICRKDPFAELSPQERIGAFHGRRRPDLRGAGRSSAAFSKALCTLAEDCWKEAPASRPDMERVFRRLVDMVEVSAGKASDRQLGASGSDGVTAQALRKSLSKLRGDVHR